MNFFQTRRQIVLGIALLVLIASLFYGALNKPKMGTGTPDDLVTEQEIDIDEPTKFIFTNRVAVFQAALAAQEDFEEMTGQRKDWDLYMEIASNAIMYGDLATARQAYEDMLQLNPLHIVGWGNLGNVLVDMHDYEAALDAYSQVIDMNPTEAAYRNYIRVLEYPETGDRDDEVKEMLDAGVANVGQTSWFMVNLAEWYVRHGECDQAFAHYEVAQDVAPELESITKDYEEAKQTCGK
ncbi:MAG: tetratricopeptide repeat protein [Patescibacteria group bacterium]